MEKRCPVCGLTLALLAAQGRLGCPECYRVFAREVEMAVERLHGVPAPAEPYPWPTRGARPRPDAPETVPPRS